MSDIYETEEVENSDGSKKKKPKALRIVVALLVLCLIALCVVGIFKLIDSLNYMKPVNSISKIYNERSHSALDAYVLSRNGADAQYYKQAVKLLEASDYYEIYFDDMEEGFEAYYRDLAAANGGGIKAKFDVTGKRSKMDEGELAVIYKELEEKTAEYKEIHEKLAGLTKEDYSAISEKIGLSVKKVKKLCSVLSNYTAAHMEVNFDKGYYITGRFVLTDESKNTVDKTDKIKLAVIRLNGKWCIYDGAAEGILLTTGNEELARNNLLLGFYYDNIAN